MKVVVPGVAFGALKDSSFPESDPDLWKRLLTYSVTYARGRGISVHLDLDANDLQMIRDCLSQMNRRLHSLPYPVRGTEGNITMQSIGIALGRLDDALRGSVES